MLVFECFFFGLFTPIIPALILLLIYKATCSKNIDRFNPIGAGILISILYAAYILAGTDLWMSDSYFGRKYGLGFIIGYPCMCIGAIVSTMTISWGFKR